MFKYFIEKVEVKKFPNLVVFPNWDDSWTTQILRLACNNGSRRNPDDWYWAKSRHLNPDEIIEYIKPHNLYVYTTDPSYEFDLEYEDKHRFFFMTKDQKYIQILSYTMDSFDINLLTRIVAESIYTQKIHIEDHIMMSIL